MDKNVTLELTVDHLNVILHALSKQPLEAVIMTFTEIQKQADPQVRGARPEGPLSDKVLN
jgi:hypothetical protein